MSGEIHSVGPFILGKSLGAGATGKVKLGFHKETGFKVAVKIINKEFLSARPSMRRKVEREIVVMKIIDHNNVLKLYDVYETSKYLFLILEYVEGGELFDYLSLKGSLEPSEALHFFQQIMRGLDYCHSHIICHRDLKPENLLFVESEKSIKIADFGMASLMRQSTLLHTSCGSPHYASPEVVSGNKYNGMMADIWSCGVILYALLSGKLPFDDDNIRRLLSKVKSGVFAMPAFIPKDAQDLIQKMLVVDVSKRLTMKGVKEHPWFNSNSPSPHSLLPLKSVEEMEADPLEDLSMIDDEILRSLKALGLGTEVDIQLALTTRRANVIIVFYRMLKARKESQDTSELYPSVKSNNRSKTTHGEDERSFLSHSGGIDIRARSRSVLGTNPNQPSHARRSYGNLPRPSTPLTGPQYHRHRLPHAAPRSMSNSSSGSGSSSESLLFPITDLGNNGTSSSSEALAPHPEAPSMLSPPSSPQVRRRQPSFTQTHTNSPPQSPRDNSSVSASIPINIDKFRKLRLAPDIVPGSPPGSPVVGSNPQRSWFSNFFTGSPQTSPRGELLYTMQTHKDGVELAAEIQRALSALNTVWNLDNEDLYKGEYKAADGTKLKFSMEVMNGKNKQDVDIRVVVVSLERGPAPYFNFLCAQVHNEINL